MGSKRLRPIACRPRRRTHQLQRLPRKSISKSKGIQRVGRIQKQNQTPPQNFLQGPRLLHYDLTSYKRRWALDTWTKRTDWLESWLCRLGHDSKKKGTKQSKAKVAQWKETYRKHVGRIDSKLYPVYQFRNRAKYLKCVELHLLEWMSESIRKVIEDIWLGITWNIQLEGAYVWGRT